MPRPLPARLAFLVVLAVAAPVLAQGPSAGCALLNGPQFDGFYAFENTGPRRTTFAAGDVLSFAATDPTGTREPVAQIELLQGLLTLIPVAVEPFPGEITWTIPADVEAVFRWRTAPGPDRSEATWTVSCDSAPYCGDGALDPGEACDDGNNNNDDGCGATCFLECGNAVLNGTEQCDDGNIVDSDDCTNSCTNAVCGDGILWNQGTGAETCDDGNTVRGDGCDANCRVEAVPTLGEWGAISLALLLLAFGSLELRRHGVRRNRIGTRLDQI